MTNQALTATHLHCILHIYILFHFMILEYKRQNKHLIDPDDTQLTSDLRLAATQVMETSDQSLSPIVLFMMVVMWQTCFSLACTYDIFPAFKPFTTLSIIKLVFRYYRRCPLAIPCTRTSCCSTPHAQLSESNYPIRNGQLWYYQASCEIVWYVWPHGLP